MQGKSISGYTLQRLLGTGGMAEVWYAENRIGKAAAVKMLLPKLCQDESITSRFLTEAKVMVELSHPNIRQVFDYGDVDGRPAIVMEYLEGDDLKARMKRGQRFTDENLKRWWNQLVSALNYTHQKGIVHRDIKPSNIFVDTQGNIKLLDFGIAKNNEGGTGTLTGSTLGTRIYMSPEQVKDPKRVGPAADAYSLAVSFVHLLSGKAPYDSTTSSDFEIQVSIVSQPLDLSGIPAFWQKVLSPYLEKEAAQRPTLQPITDMKGDDNYISNPAASSFDEDGTLVEGKYQKATPVAPKTAPISNTSAPQKKTRMLPWIIAGAACVATVVMAVIGMGRGSSNGGDLAFLTNLNDGLQSANHVLSNHIDQKYTAFAEFYSLDEEKAGPSWEQAITIREESNALIDYIESLKWNLVKQVEGMDALNALDNGVLKTCDTVVFGRRCYDINIANLKSGGATSKATSIMLGGRASELATKIGHYRDLIINVIGPEHAHEIGLVTSSNWGNATFGKKTLSEDIATLNKIVSEIQSAELNTLTKLMLDIHANDYTFNEIGARVFAESSYLLSGQTYHAEAIVTSWQNSQATAIVRLDGGPEKEYLSDGQGVINLDFNCGVGQHKYTGYIMMLNPTTNELEDYPFENSFTVAPPAVSVSATRMNVVYRGIDNPIAVGGGVGGDISATATSGTLTRTGNGTYVLRPGAADEVTISVSSGGSSLGSMKFRVKDLPKPVAIIRNVVNGMASKSALLNAGGIVAEMKDFNFDGVSYTVVGFTMRYKTKAGTTKEAKANSGSFTDEMRNAINSANVGDVFVFSAIQLKGNDGKVKTLETPIGVEIK